MRPLYALNLPPVPATTLQLDMRYAYNGSGYRLWFFNSETFRADFE